MCDVRAERAKPHLQRAPRSGVSLSNDLLVQLTSAVASLIPSLTEVRKVGINDGMGARPSSRWRSYFLFKCPIDTAGTDADELGNLLFNNFKRVSPLECSA